MREELHRYLDEELELGELPRELREEAEAWEAFLADVQAAGPAAAPPGLAARVLDAVLAGGDLPEGVAAAGAEGLSPPWWRRAAEWWVRPRPVPVSPLAGLLVAAAIVLLVLAPPRLLGPPEVETASATAGEPGPVYVKFFLEAPSARSVYLAGDFNGWSADIPLHDPDGDGVWSATVGLPPGVHEYMFVVDGERWVTDPYAERYADDGFGNRNAVLAIATPYDSGV